jgi:hypothetical protein
MIILSDVVTVRERGKYLSLLGIGIASGSGKAVFSAFKQLADSSAAGPFLGAILAEKVRWSWAFWIISPREL